MCIHVLPSSWGDSRHDHFNLQDRILDDTTLHWEPPHSKAALARLRKTKAAPSPHMKLSTGIGRPAASTTASATTYCWRPNHFVSWRPYTSIFLSSRTRPLRAAVWTGPSAFTRVWTFQVPIRIDWRVTACRSPFLLPTTDSSCFVACFPIFIVVFLVRGVASPQRTKKKGRCSSGNIKQFAPTTAPVVQSPVMMSSFSTQKNSFGNGALKR